MSKHSLPQATTQSLQEGGSELARAQADWCRAVDLLADAGRRMARLTGDPRKNPLEGLRFLLYVIQGDVEHTMAAFLSHFEPCNTDKS